MVDGHISDRQRDLEGIIASKRMVVNEEARSRAALGMGRRHGWRWRTFAANKHIIGQESIFSVLSLNDGFNDEGTSRRGSAREGDLVLRAGIVVALLRAERLGEGAWHTITGRIGGGGKASIEALVRVVGGGVGAETDAFEFEWTNSGVDDLGIERLLALEIVASDDNVTMTGVSMGLIVIAALGLTLRVGNWSDVNGVIGSRNDGSTRGLLLIRG